jgi:hypothetical protein
MKYLYHAKVIDEEDVPVGAHYRAREDMLKNVSYQKSADSVCNVVLLCCAVEGE